MLLKDLPLCDIKVGQVVRFEHSGKFAVICQVTAPVPCNETDNYKPKNWYDFPEYPKVHCFHESGRVDQGSPTDHKVITVMNRVLTVDEMFKFTELVAKESLNWEVFE